MSHTQNSFLANTDSSEGEFSEKAGIKYYKKIWQVTVKYTISTLFLFGNHNLVIRIGVRR
jgi:hypothetical protein